MEHPPIHVVACTHVWKESISKTSLFFFHFVVWFLGIFFKYDLSSIMVRVENRRRSFWGFLVRLCGIVGGIFATSGNNGSWRGTHSVWNKTLFSFIKQLFYSANLRQFGVGGGGDQADYESSLRWFNSSLSFGQAPLTFCWHRAIVCLCSHKLLLI